MAWFLLLPFRKFRHFLGFIENRVRELSKLKFTHERFVHLYDTAPLIQSSIYNLMHAGTDLWHVCTKPELARSSVFDLTGSVGNITRGIEGRGAERLMNY